MEHREAGTRLSYRMLELRSGALAQRLRGRGVGRDERVALYLPRCAELYVALLAVLRAGAAYLPIDEQVPVPRLRFMLEDSGARTLLTTRALLGALGEVPPGLSVLCVDELGDESSLGPAEAFPQPTPVDLAYVIYTSGTTGTPKGVCISHGNAMTYVQAMLDVYGVSADDRVLQGFSTGFDASVEELWMAFATGATLVVGSLETMRDVDELPGKLRELDITVFSTVPTLLRVLDEDALPRLRLVLAGGEAVTADVVDKWAVPGRRFFNGYGPTEATVVATYSWCERGKPVTIGRPLPGYLALVLDEASQEVAAGVEGELCIGGPAVSLLGYLNRPELNAEKFFVRDGERFYHTGDLVCRDAQGELLYRGRLDAQVKVRGYRVELGEIETHLARALQRQPAGATLQGAVVALREEDGVSVLVAYLLGEKAPGLDLSALLAELRERMPPYMIPARFALLAPCEVPRLASGKVHRPALPAPTALTLLEEPELALRESTGQAEDAALVPEVRSILRVWRTVLHHGGLGADDSFFEHGGNSILAGQSTTLFRRDAELGNLTIRDLYQFPTARALAVRLGERQRHSAERQATAAPAAAARLQTPVGRRQFLAVALAQTLVLLGLGAGLAHVGYWLVCWTPALYEASSWGSSLLLFAGFPLAAFALPFLAALGGKALLGTLREGEYPIWSWGYFRWWLTMILHAPARGIAAGMVGSPFAPVFYRLLGARIGRGVFLASPLDEPELVTIGDGASISEEVKLRTHALEGGVLRLRRITLGHHTFVGAQSVLCGGARLDDGARLHPLSCLTEDVRAPAGSEWSGSPAARVAPGASALSRLLAEHERLAAGAEAGWQRPAAALRVVFWQLFYGYLNGLVHAVLPVLELILLLSAGALGLGAGSADLDLPLLLALAVPFAALRAFGGLGLLIAEKWLFTGRARAGTISLGSHEYVRRWFCNRLMVYLASPQGLRPFTETLFMPHVCRALGMRVGRRTEISDAAGFQPDLVSIGDGAMLADRCVLGVPVVHRGRMTLGTISLGERSFVANVAHVPITTPVLRDGSLVGVLSIPPDEPPAGSDWLGSPPIRLLNRTRSSAPDARTFAPPRRLVWARSFFNVWKIILPGALTSMVAWTALSLSLSLGASLNGWAAGVAQPLVFLGALVAMLGLPVVLKWLLVGRYPTGERYLWSFWMWRIELVYEVELRVMTAAAGVLGGTPFLPMWYRAMGARIGRQVCIHGGSLMEADLVTIGDHASVEGFLQTHLFEDRVMKLGHVVIGEGCSVGSEGCVLYDSTMGAGSRLGDLSLIMKHETFLPDRKYRGLPAENVHEESATPADTAEPPPPLALAS